VNRRVCHIITDLDVGGAETTLWRLLLNEKRNMENSLIVSLSDIGPMGVKLQESGFKVIALNIKRNNPLSVLASGILLHKKLLEFRPDIILAWMYHACLISILFKYKYRIVWNIRHSLEFYHSEKIHTKLIIRICGLYSKHPNAIIFNSHNSRQQHYQIANYIHKNLITVQNGIDINVFKPKSKRKLEDANNIVIGHVGNYRKIKGHSVFLQAMSLLANQYDISLAMAGNHVDPNNQKLLRLLKEYGLLDITSLHGSIRNMSEYYNSLDIFVLSSHSEGFPNVLVEAMSSGLPCIGTNVGDVPHLLENEYIVAPNDHVKLASRCRLFLNDENKREKCGVSNRELIIKNNSIEEMVYKYTRVYEDVCSST
jgi:glycosyltransferase involved in cell wall biosynthesis